MLVLALAFVATVARAANTPAPEKPAPVTYPFTFDTLLTDAKRRAAAPYAPQHNRLPAGLDKLSPEQYRSIRFNPDAGIWLAEQPPFRLELFRAAYNMQTPFRVSTLDNSGAKNSSGNRPIFKR